MYITHFDISVPYWWIVHDLFTADECKAHIEQVDQLGTEKAKVGGGAGFYAPKLRNNQRLIVDSPDYAALLFERATEYLPEEMNGCQLVGVNERLRYYLYGPGQFFGPHRDGAFIRDDYERSRLTFMVYLNDDFEGGHTIFHDLSEEARPRRGSALFFQHRLLHEGAKVTAGQKYVLRTDVMYRGEKAM